MVGLLSVLEPGASRLPWLGVNEYFFPLGVPLAAGGLNRAEGLVAVSAAVDVIAAVLAGAAANDGFGAALPAGANDADAVAPPPAVLLATTGVKPPKVLLSAPDGAPLLPLPGRLKPEKPPAAAGAPPPNVMGAGVAAAGVLFPNKEEVGPRFSKAGATDVGGEGAFAGGFFEGGSVAAAEGGANVAGAAEAGGRDDEGATPDGSRAGEGAQRGWAGVRSTTERVGGALLCAALFKAEKQQPPEAEGPGPDWMPGKAGEATCGEEPVAEGASRRERAGFDTTTGGASSIWRVRRIRCAATHEALLVASGSSAGARRAALAAGSTASSEALPPKAAASSPPHDARERLPTGCAERPDDHCAA